MNKRTLALLAVMLFVAPMLASCWDPAPNDEPSNEAKRKYALFIEQIQFWTDSEAIDLSTIGRTDRATVHLTYLAPQLIDAAIDYQMALKGKSVDEQWVRDEVHRRLQDSKRIPLFSRFNPLRCLVMSWVLVLPITHFIVYGVWAHYSAIGV
ncbi:MAG: hypothetical protein IPK16_22035 [Anaerolineales bacterium]|nr:hypothetical protein [Anaerolineales bacterium]